MNRLFVQLNVPVLLVSFAATPSWAAFHLMQIEQVIGGVNGDTTAQAIQLRMRSGGQNILGNSTIRARDAAGGSQVTLSDPTTSVANKASGSRVLITTPNFANYTDVPVVSDFTMDPIPASSLASGQISFDSNGATKYWILSWGGASFTGSTLGSLTNDADGNFGPPVDIALPSNSLQALLFPGAASASSTTNLADYVLTAGAATFTNNAGNNFSLVAPPADNANFDGDNDIDGKDFFIWQSNSGTPGTQSDGDANNNGDVEAGDLVVWEAQYGTPPPLAGLNSVPEPQAVFLWLLFGTLVGTRSCRRWTSR